MNDLSPQEANINSIALASLNIKVSLLIPKPLVFATFCCSSIVASKLIVMSSFRHSLMLIMMALGMVHARRSTEPKRLNDFGIHVDPGVCPTAEASERARERMTYEIGDILAPHVCSGPGWRRVAFIDMNDTNHSCPSGLRPISSPRSCGSSLYSTSQSCSSTIFSIQGLSYRFVCGRIVGYHYGTAYAFWPSLSEKRTLENDYVDGVSLTHGRAGQRQHIWSFATGINNNPNYGYPTYNCPRNASTAPSFVGSNYFCEMAKGNYSNPVWDGKGCDALWNTYCHVNHPPWFARELSARVIDDIEL